MTDSKHTPGPWRISGVSMQTGNVSVSMEEHRIVIAEVTNAASFGDMIAGAMRRGGGSFDQGDCHTQMSNARLIASAPELLAAVRGLLHSLVGDEFADDIPAVVAARTAIAKAEGK